MTLTLVVGVHAEHLKEPGLFTGPRPVVSKEGEGFVKAICFGRVGGTIGPDAGGKEVGEIDGVVLED